MYFCCPRRKCGPIKKNRSGEKAPYPFNVSTKKMLNEQKAEQQTYSEAEKMKVYDIKDKKVSLAMRIFWVIIRTCVIMWK